MRRAIGQAQLSCSSFVKVQPINESDGSLDSTTLRLRIEFVQSLCIAEEFGVLDSIENIAAMIHHGRSTIFKEQVKQNPIEQPPLGLTDEPIKRLIDDMVSINIDDDKSKDESIAKTEQNIKSSQLINSPISLSTTSDNDDGGDCVGGATALLDEHIKTTNVHHDGSTRKGKGNLLYGMISGKFSLVDYTADY